MKIILINGSQSESQLELIIDLRIRVWSDSLALPDAMGRFSVDQHDASGWHYLIEDDEKLVASARLCMKTDGLGIPDQISFSPIESQIRYPCGFMNRLVVDKQFRNLGLATQLDQLRIRQAERLGAREIWVEACADRIKTLHRQRFEIVGESADKQIKGEWMLMRRCIECNSR